MREGAEGFSPAGSYVRVQESAVQAVGKGAGTQTDRQTDADRRRHRQTHTRAHIPSHNAIGKDGVAFHATDIAQRLTPHTHTDTHLQTGTTHNPTTIGTTCLWSLTLVLVSDSWLSSLAVLLRVRVVLATPGRTTSEGVWALRM